MKESEMFRANKINEANKKKLEKRNRLINKNWVCSKCRVKLPKRGGGQWGQVWRFRYEHYLEENRDKEDPSSGYYCDPCTEAMEMGLDFE